VPQRGHNAAVQPRPGTLPGMVGRPVLLVFPVVVNTPPSVQHPPFGSKPSWPCQRFGLLGLILQSSGSSMTAVLSPHPFIFILGGPGVRTVRVLVLE